MSELKLKVITPSGSGGEVDCDSVHLVMPDNSEGKGGGSIGIRKGHENALIALDKGRIEAFENGKCVFTQDAEGGFAVVKNDVITVMTQVQINRE